MPPLPVKTTAGFYASLIDSIHAAADLRALRQAHAVTLTAGLAAPDALRSKLSACYARCGALDDALVVFSRANRRPAFVYNSLIRAHVDLRLFTPALSLYRRMLAESKPPDHRTFAAVLKCCSGLGSILLGRAAHAATFVFGEAHSVSVSNALVFMYSKCEDPSSALEVFDRMPKKDLVSWTSMMGALRSNGCSEDAVRAFDGMLEMGLTPDEKTMTAVLAACANGGLVETGRRMFGMLDGRYGVGPRVEHYTCMVGLLGRAGRLEEVEELMEEMAVEPDEAFWRAVVKVCMGSGKMDVLERVAERMYRKEEEERDQSYAKLTENPKLGLEWGVG